MKTNNEELELKLWLANKLGVIRVLSWDVTGLENYYEFEWGNENNRPVEETEWEYITKKVESKLTDEQKEMYSDDILWSQNTEHSAISACLLGLYLSWQDRAKFLKRVLENNK